MPARILGMIGVTPPASDAQLIIIEGALSPEYVVESARAHENAGYDMALVGYTSSSAEGFLVALHAAHHTRQLKFLIAHRPGFVAPTLMARKIATFDQLTRGRIALHIITGKTDAEQHGDGDFSPKPERYQRAAEYLAVMRRAWSEAAPFDFEGKFYRVSGASSDVRPFQRPWPEILFGGASDGALAMGTKYCDTYAMYAEPLAAARSRIAEMRDRAARHGRSMGFNISLRPIIAETEAAAWDKARRILAKLEGGEARGWSRQEASRQAVDNAGRRLMGFAAEKDIHDARLWMPITRATGALGNTSCLVGTPAQVAEVILEYYKLGVDSFLIRGFDPERDTTEFGRALIPLIREGAARIDKIDAPERRTGTR